MKKFSLAIFSIVLVGAHNLSSAAAVTHYSQRYLNSNEYVRTQDYANSNPGRGYVVDYTGAAVEFGTAGSRTFAYRNGRGGYVFRTEASDVYAKADLSAGDLKARTYLYTGANQAGSGSSPAFGADRVTASASASFADSFSFASGSSPYLWKTGDVFNFNFNIHGDVTLPFEHANPPDSTWNTWSSLKLNVYRPGGLQAIKVFSDFDYFAYATLYGFSAASAEFTRLINLSNALHVSTTGWCLGDNLVVTGFCDGSGFNQVVLDQNGEANLSHAFSPGGDFEFILGLETQVRVDLSYEDTYGMLDFSNTVTAGFTAPDGATVYSASGRFPDTLALVVTQVPEPGTLALLSGALGLLVIRRKATAT